MHELKVTVTKVMGKCTSNPAVRPGDTFFVSDGDIRIPDGGFICLWALQTLMPLLPAKERDDGEEKDGDWMRRVHHAQCPDPAGRVVYKIERAGKLDREEKEAEKAAVAEAAAETGGETAGTDGDSSGDLLADLEVEVEEIQGRCSSRMVEGDKFTLKGGRLYIPPGKHFCLYALQAALPLLPAKQRVLEDGDWMKNDWHVLCPDPAGNVILRIDRKE